MNFHIFSAYNSELSEYSESTSEKNSEFRIKVGNYHPYSEIIPSLLGENFRISFANFGAISELHSEKNSELHSDKNSV